MVIQLELISNLDNANDVFIFFLNKNNFDVLARFYCFLIENNKSYLAVKLGCTIERILKKKVYIIPKYYKKT